MGRQTPDRAAQAALTLGRWALWLRTRIQMRRPLRRRRRDRVSLAVSRGGRRPRCPGLQGGRPDCREPARPGAGTLPSCRGPGQLRPEARGTAQRVWRSLFLVPSTEGPAPTMAPCLSGSPAFPVCPAQGPPGEQRGWGRKQAHRGNSTCLPPPGGSEGREGHVDGLVPLALNHRWPQGGWRGPCVQLGPLQP